MVKYIFRIKWTYTKTMIGMSMSYKSKFLTLRQSWRNNACDL